MKILITLIFLIFLINSCQKQPELTHDDIANIDNIIVHENQGMNFIDSMLKVYPKSEYLHGIRMMLLANIGYYEEAQHELIVLGEKGIYGTFTRMGWAHARSTRYYSKHKSYFQSFIGDFIRSLDLDNHKVNIWTRIDLFKIYKDLGMNKKAENILLEAYEINPKNSYILEEITKFYLERGYLEDAKLAFEQINPKYYPEGVDILRKRIDSLEMHYSQ